MQYEILRPEVYLLCSYADTVIGTFAPFRAEVLFRIFPSSLPLHINKMHLTFISVRVSHL